MTLAGELGTSRDGLEGMRLRRPVPVVERGDGGTLPGPPYEGSCADDGGSAAMGVTFSSPVVARAAALPPADPPEVDGRGLLGEAYKQETSSLQSEMVIQM